MVEYTLIMTEEEYNKYSKIKKNFKKEVERRANEIDSEFSGQYSAFLFFIGVLVGCILFGIILSMMGVDII